MLSRLACPGAVTNTLALARKYRPKRFSELLGQEHVVRALTHALDSGRLHQAYLLTGTRGIGKTTIARILAKTLNCETGVTADPCGQCAACLAIDAGRFPDLIELDAASNTGVDNMREILDNARYAPTAGRYKVYLIDEVHMLSKSAFNSMLKTLEEPPEHVKFVLATTDPQKIPVTVLSRCLQFNLKAFPPERVAEQLEKVLIAEGITFERPALRLIGEAAQGSMRDALSITDQAIAFGHGRVEEAQVRQMLGSVDRDFVWRVLEALQTGQAQDLAEEVRVCFERALSADDALAQLARAFTRIALFQLAPGSLDPDDPEHAAISRYAASFSPEQVQLYYQICLHGRDDLRLAPDEETALLMTLLRLHAFAPVTPVALQDIRSTPAAAKPPTSVASDRLAERSAAARTSPTSPPATPATAATTHREFDGNWPRLVASLPLAATTRELARHSTLLEFAAHKVRLALPQEKRPLATQKERLQGILSEYFGRALKLEIELVDQVGETLADQQQQAQDARQKAVEAAFLNDPVVQVLMQETGAQVIPGSIRPLD